MITVNPIALLHSDKQISDYASKVIIDKMGILIMHLNLRGNEMFIEQAVQQRDRYLFGKLEQDLHNLIELDLFDFGSGFPLVSVLPIRLPDNFIEQNRYAMTF